MMIKCQFLYVVGFVLWNSFLFAWCAYFGKEGMIKPNYRVYYGGDSIVINCNSYNKKTWYKDGRELKMYIDVGGNVKIDSAREEHSGIYACEVLLPEGDTIYSNVTILVGGKDNDHIDPKSFTADLGQNVYYECKDGENIKWYFERTKYMPQSPPIATGEMFHINSVSVNDSGSYFCYGKYRHSNRHFLAKSTLSLYDQSIVDPLELRVRKGSMARFSCNGKGQILWVKEGSGIPLTKKRELIFSETEYHDQGYYMCRVKHADNTESKARVHLEVLDDRGRLRGVKNGKTRPITGLGHFMRGFQGSDYTQKPSPLRQPSLQRQSLPPRQLEDSFDYQSPTRPPSPAYFPVRQPSSTRKPSPLRQPEDLVYHPSPTRPPSPAYFQHRQSSLSKDLSHFSDISDYDHSSRRQTNLPNYDLSPRRQPSPLYFPSERHSSPKHSQSQSSDYQYFIPKRPSQRRSSSSHAGQTCPALRIDNGEVSLQNDDQNTAIYKCSVGYKLNGPIQRHCHSGQWNGRAPTCESASSFMLLHKQNLVFHALTVIGVNIFFET